MIFFHNSLIFKKKKKQKPAITDWFLGRLFYYFLKEKANLG